MKIKFEIEVDTDNAKDEQRLEEIIRLLQELKEQLEIEQ